MDNLLFMIGEIDTLSRDVFMKMIQHSFKLVLLQGNVMNKIGQLLRVRVQVRRLRPRQRREPRGDHLLDRVRS